LPIGSTEALQGCVEKFFTSSAYETPSEAMARNVLFVAMGHLGFCRKQLYFSGNNFIFQETTLFFVYSQPILRGRLDDQLQL